MDIEDEIKGHEQYVARHIAKANGDCYDSAPRDKRHWREYRRINFKDRESSEPFQCDYEEMARAAIKATHDYSWPQREKKVRADDQKS